MKLEAAAQSYRPFGLMSSIDGTDDLSAEAKREIRDRRNEQRLMDMDARLSEMYKSLAASTDIIRDAPQTAQQHQGMYR